MKTILLITSIIIMMSELRAGEILASGCNSTENNYSISVSADNLGKLTLKHWSNKYLIPKKIFVSRMFDKVPSSREIIEMREKITTSEGSRLGKSIFVRFNTKHMIRVNNTRYLCGDSYRIFFPGDWVR